MDLPIHSVLLDLMAAFATHTRVVVVAPPGAGKSTVVPLALLDVLPGKIIVLEPRRLAARAVAARMAHTLGQKLGETVGYRVRMDSKISAATRIEVVTEGVFTRQILDDPELRGVSAVLLDEFHERSLNTDLGLALALDAQGLRPDLRIGVMSATLDGARVAALMDDAVQITCDGRCYPIETRHVDIDPRAPLAHEVSRAVLAALHRDTGSVLVFLPGTADIHQVEQRLRHAIHDTAVHIAPLYGQLEAAAQDAAIAPAPPGHRKVVLATAIAETSLTIEGVRVVIDSGFARQPVFDPTTGLSHLQTVRVSQAAADQRRGRAGRTAPGVCYRLWGEGQTRALAAYDTPEILTRDLSGLMLDLARWGARPDQLTWLDLPPAAACAEASALLQRLGATDSDGRLTAHGRAMAELGTHPRLAHMLLTSPDPQQAADLALLVEDRTLADGDIDLGVRLAALHHGNHPRVRTARQHGRDRVRGLHRSGDEDPALTLARAFPDRLAKRQGPSEKSGTAGGEVRFLLVNGRSGYLPAHHPLAAAPWLVITDMQGRAGAARISSAMALDEATARSWTAAQTETHSGLSFDLGSTTLLARRIERLGAIVLSETPLARPSPEMIHAAWCDAVRAHGLGVLRPCARAQMLHARLTFARACGAAVPDVSDAGLIGRIDDWLPHAGTALRASDLDLYAAWASLLDAHTRHILDRTAPAHLSLPAGRPALIDYGAEGGPLVAVRLQDLFGVTLHPTVGGQPLTIDLLSPADRPVQRTRDLPGFWAGSYADVRRDLRGRYPKHYWPDNPAIAPASRRRPSPEKG